MMRATIALATLSVLAADAWAQQPEAPTPAPAPASVVEVKAPEGWILDEGRGAAQAKALRASHKGGDARTSAAFYRSTEPGGIFLVGEVTFEPAPADVAAAARAELASVRSVVEAVGGTLVTWRFQGGDPLLPEARLEWKDPSIGTTSITRALVVRTAGSLSIVTAECVIGGDALALRAPCEAALAGVKPAAGPARLEVGMGATDPASAPAPEPANDGVPSGAPQLSEGPIDMPATLHVSPPTSKSEPDRRPLFLVGGIAVLALVFLWNRRNRARLEAAEARERRTSRRRSDDDDKADDDPDEHGPDGPDEAGRDAVDGKGDDDKARADDDKAADDEAADRKPGDKEPA